MVYLNHECHNHKVAPGQFGGAMCLCEKCQKKHEEEKNKAEQEDRTVVITESEFKKLRKVFETSSDIVKARHWEEFREMSGGIDVFENDHAKAVLELEQWYRDGE